VDCTWRHWGWKFLAIFSLGAAAYVGGGAYGPAKAKGAKKPADVLAAHPHYTRWMEVVALAHDGLEYAKARQAGRPLPAKRAVVHSATPSGPQRGSGGSSGTATSDKKGNNKERKEKKAKVEKKAAAAGGMQVPLATASEDDAEAAAGTPAGGGGRWVHVPT
jgi:hypothetical protein